MKILIILLLGLTGCSMSTHLGSIPKNLNDKVKIIDNRTQQQKEGYQESIFTPIKKFSDDFIEPSVIEYFNYKLENKAEKYSKDITIVINQLSIYDNYPARYGEGLSATFASLGIYYPDSNDLKDTDHILIVFSGSVNGESKEITSAEPYHAPAFALSVYDDEDFKRALNTTLDDIIKKLLP